MQRKIIVTSNCMSAGLAAALQALFPQDCFVAKSIFDFTQADKESDLAKLVGDSDVWICIDQGYFDCQSFVQKYDVKTPTIRHPSLLFSAFHPDMCYARMKDGNYTPQHYNSAIVAWAYKNALDTTEASKLFNYDTMSDLGYLRRWDNDVARLRSLFEKCELNFDLFYYHVKRHQVFMYTLNHPKPVAIVCLAKSIALNLGLSLKHVEQDVTIGDGLFANVWPVYPEVAYELSLLGSYRFKIEHRHVIGLEQFVSHCYDKYSSWGVTPSDLNPLIDIDLYNNVLGGRHG